MDNLVEIAGLDIDLSKAVRKANQGKSIIITSNEGGKPILSCWNIPKHSIARKQLQEIARKSGRESVKFYSTQKGHFCTMVVI